MKISDAAIDRLVGAKGLRDFIELAWPIVEPARELVPNWHIDVLCEHLEAVTSGELRRLVINVPPGTMKSLTCSVFWPAWTWTHTPHLKWITASYSQMIARRDALRARRLMESPWFQERWGHLWHANKDDWTNTRYSNNMSGFRVGVTVGGGVTGEHADIQLVDDPLKPIEAPGDRVDSAALRTCLEWWDETMSSRMVDPVTSRRVIIMQRLHEADISGHVLDTGHYDHLCLQMEAERHCVVSVPHKCSMPLDAKGKELDPTGIDYKDTREEGQLLWPDRFPLEAVRERQREMGSRAAAAQDQQRPMPSGGGIFKRDFVQFWNVFPRGGEMLQSWDCAFKGLDESDYVVGQLWARKGADFYLLDQVRGKMSASQTCKALLSFSGKWPKVTKKLVEDKANGPAVIELMKKKISGLIPVNPKGGKIARAQAVEPLWEAGNVYLPDPKTHPWVHDFIDELVSFNGDPGRADDQVDAMTQALVELHKHTAHDYRLAMQNIGF